MNKNFIIENLFNDVKRLRPIKHEDDRGFFSELYRDDLFTKLGFGSNYIQDNWSFSIKKGTIRGMHFQLNPKPQKKLIKVIIGSIFDVFIDLRSNSPTYLSFSSIEHNENDGWLFIPDGFAHGFCSLKDNTKILYKVDNYYDAKLDSGLNYLDPKFNIKWPFEESDIVISKKDKNLPIFDKIKNDLDF